MRDAAGSGPARSPWRRAACGREEEWTRAQLAAAVTMAMLILEKQGIQAGDRVAVLVPRSAASVIIMLALLRMGAVAAPLRCRVVSLFRDAPGANDGRSGE